MFGWLKKFLLWSYARNTWQYDVLCALILAFIFLTPQSWFAGGELRRAEAHQNPQSARSSVVIPADEFSTNPSSTDIENRVRALTNRPDSQVGDVRTINNKDGKRVAYEVDIR